MVICTQIESLFDRGAVFISTSGKARQPPDGKGTTAEGSKRCLLFRSLGRRKTSGGLSQDFVERYR